MKFLIFNSTRANNINEIKLKTNKAIPLLGDGFDIQEFQQFMTLDDRQPYLEYKQQKKHTDEVLQKVIQKQFKAKNIADLPLAERNEKIKEIYQKTGISIRQLARVLGVGKIVIENATKQER